MLFNDALLILMPLKNCLDQGKIMRNTREKIRDFYHTLKLLFIGINGTDSFISLM